MTQCCRSIFTREYLWNYQRNRFIKLNRWIKEQIRTTTKPFFRSQLAQVKEYVARRPLYVTTLLSRQHWTHKNLVCSCHGSINIITFLHAFFLLFSLWPGRLDYSFYIKQTISRNDCAWNYSVDLLLLLRHQQQERRVKRAKENWALRFEEKWKKKQIKTKRPPRSTRNDDYLALPAYVESNW